MRREIAVYIQNRWYVVAACSEIGRKPLRRRILNEPLVMYRSEAGDVIVMDNTCPHRFAPLSEGILLGDRIQCPYHGIEFAPDGKCVRVPGQTKIAAKLAIRSYRTIERYGWVWAWIGEQSKAAESLLPHWAWLDDPNWDAHLYYYYVKANYLLVIDNLLDLSHVSFTHLKTVGDPKFAETPPSVEVEGHEVRNIFRIVDTEPAPFFRRIGGFTGRVDRTSIATFTPPAYINLLARVVPHGNPDPRSGIDMRTQVGCVTPETPTTCHYFTSWSRNFAVGKSWVTDIARKNNDATFAEDAVMIEAQQQIMDEFPERKPVALYIDGAQTRARRIVDSVISQQGDAMDVSVAAE
jgi:phenylpropionate dioxygenase-like ring-hydroxylating dioxygenase large terminal subunit